MTTPIEFDVDIDLKDRDQLLAHLEHTPASVIKDGVRRHHPTGVYLQCIPDQPLEGCAEMDHREAANEGYFKFDFLNNHVYDQVRSPEHLDQLLAAEPVWELLQHEEVVENLYHIGSYYPLVSAYSPRSVEQLAMVLALIRPAKRHLQGLEFEEIKDEIWTPPTNGEYYFKRSHAIAFATAIVVQLNLLAESVSASN